MAKNYAHGNTMLRESYDYRVALPIIAVTIFCFGFVIISSLNHHSNTLESKSKQTQTLHSKNTELLDPQGQLNTLTPAITGTNLNTSSSDQTSSSASNGSSTDTTGSSTSSPETNNSNSSVLSTIKTANPQSTNTQQSNLQLAPSPTTVPTHGTSSTLGKGLNTPLQATKSNMTNVLNEIL